MQEVKGGPFGTQWQCSCDRIEQHEAIIKFCEHQHACKHDGKFKLFVEYHEGHVSGSKTNGLYYETPDRNQIHLTCVQCGAYYCKNLSDEHMQKIWESINDQPVFRTANMENELGTQVSQQKQAFYEARNAAHKAGNPDWHKIKIFDFQ